MKDFLKEVHGYSETQIGKFFASAESSKETIETAKTKSSDSYDEGLEDGKTKFKKYVIDSVNKELGIKIIEKDFKKLDEFGKLLKPVIEEKFKSTDNSESDSVKEWKKKYEDVLAEKDKEVLEAKGSAKREVEELRRDSLAKEILQSEGYTIPSDSKEYAIKLEMVKSAIEKKGWNYELDPKDGLFYRMTADGTKERVSNKNVTFNDDFKNYADFSFGKTPAEGKSSGMGKDIGGAGGSGTTPFDWTKVETKGFVPPSNKEEARKIMSDPLIPLADRGIVRNFIDNLDLEEKAV
jgi:hypothetical protein